MHLEKDSEMFPVIDSYEDYQKYLQVARNACDKYYNTDTPVLTDSQYDLLITRLESYEERCPEFADGNSPTQKVGTPPVTGNVLIHHKQMMSLMNKYTLDDIKKFFKGYENESYTASIKIDGLALEAVYMNGKLSTLSKRGDGVEGDDITKFAEYINIPKYTSFPGTVAVYGEAAVPLEDFEEIKHLYKNPRSFISGVLNSEAEPDTELLPYVTFFAYGIDKDVLDLSTLYSGFQYPESTWFENSSCTFHVPKYHCLASLQSVLDFLSDCELNHKVLTDGWVVALDNPDLRKKLGQTAKHYKWSVAYKPEGIGSTVTTVINSIVHQVGPSGVITPVAKLEPVLCDGVTIRSSSLRNYFWCEERDISVGAIVTVKRDGNVVPGVHRIVEAGDELVKPPEVCPVCGSRTYFDKSYLMCSGGTSCPAQTSAQLVKFVSKKGLDIDNFGPATIETLLSAGYLTNILSIFSLRDFRDEMLKLEGFAENSVDSLLNAIEDAKATTVAKVLYGLGIPEIGEETARKIAIHCKTVSELMYPGGREKLGIGQVAYNSLVDYVHKHSDMLFDLWSILHFSARKMKPLPSELSFLIGQNLVITGQFAVDRNVIQQLLKSYGVQVVSAISGKTTYLLGGTGVGGKKAEKLSVQLEGNLVNLKEDAVVMPSFEVMDYLNKLLDF